MKEHIFEANGEEYEVKIGQSVQNQIIVQAFNTKNNEPSGFSYSVDFDTNFVMENVLGISGVQSLIEIIKDDVVNKRREELETISKNLPREFTKSSGIVWI